MDAHQYSCEDAILIVQSMTLLFRRFGEEEPFVDFKGFPHLRSALEKCLPPYVAERESYVTLLVSLMAVFSVLVPGESP